MLSAAFWLQGNAHRAQAASNKIFNEMMQSVERWHAEICQLIQANLQAAMAQASHPTVDLPSTEPEGCSLNLRDSQRFPTFLKTCTTIILHT